MDSIKAVNIAETSVTQRQVIRDALRSTGGKMFLGVVRCEFEKNVDRLCKPGISSDELQTIRAEIVANRSVLKFALDILNEKVDTSDDDPIGSGDHAVD